MSYMFIQSNPPPRQSQNQIDGESNLNQSKVMQEYGGLCVGPTKPAPPPHPWDVMSKSKIMNCFT